MTHSRTIVLVVLLAAAALTGCRSIVDSEIPRDAIALEVHPLPLSVTQHQYTQLRERARLVIRDDESWMELWNAAMAGMTPRPPLPPVDFASEILVVAAMGARPTGGFTIAIDDVLESNGALWVVVREQSPGRTCALTQMPTAPMAAVRVSRRDGPVTFVERTSVHQCD